MTAKLDLGALRALCSIRDHGGVSRAAVSLGLSQSAVSHKIRRLEERLGCAVLDRRAGHPLFTEEGEKLLVFARRMLALHDEAVDALSTEPLSGRIRLGVTEDATAGGLSRVLGRFTRLQPAVAVHVGVAQSRVIAERLDRGELDAGVLQVFADDRRPGDMTLMEDTLHWVKSPDLSLSKEQPVPLLTFGDDCFYRDWALRSKPLPEHGFRSVMQCASIAGMTSAIRAGLGITLLNGRHIGPGIEVMTNGFPPPPDIAYIVRVGRNARSSTIMALVKTVAGDGDWRSASQAR